MMNKTWNSVMRVYNRLSAKSTERYVLAVDIDSHPLMSGGGVEINRSTFGRVWITCDSARRTLGLTVVS